MGRSLRFESRVTHLSRLPRSPTESPMLIAIRAKMEQSCRSWKALCPRRKDGALEARTRSPCSWPVSQFLAWATGSSVPQDCLGLHRQSRACVQDADGLQRKERSAAKPQLSSAECNSAVSPICNRQTVDALRVANPRYSRV